MTNWNNIKIRASALHKIMANSRSNPQLTELQAKKLSELESKDVLTEKQKEEMAELLVKKANGSKVILSDGCIEYLMEVYAWETERMIPVGKESLDILQTRKGRECEDDAVQLLNVHDGETYKVHKERINNDFLSGEIDIYLGESVYAATNVTDIKNAFDYPGFLKKINNGLENGQEYQMKAYGDITGSNELFIANTLVTASPEVMIEMQWKVAKKMNAVTLESPEFLEEWKKWEHSMTFDNLPIQKRVHKIKVDPFTDTERQKVYDRVKVCREFLFKFDQERQNIK